MEKKQGWIPDFTKNEFYFGEIHLDQGYVADIFRLDDKREGFKAGDRYIIPGLVDSHIHIESSMLIPSAFAEEAVRFGTLSCVADPHEIANVLGWEGVKYMIEDAGRVPVKIRFTAPSCVPATGIEESGARIGVEELRQMMKEYDFAGLGEVMDFPAVVSGEKEVFGKIKLFSDLGKPVDGHAPGLRGVELKKYIDAGIGTDHEAVNMEEAREKIKLGMKILIREGSAAKNFDKLWPLVREFPDEVMLCSDDLHPDDLLTGHIDRIVRRGLKKGLGIFDLMRAASINPVKHYSLDMGLLRKGDRADFIVVGDLENFIIEESYIDGVCVHFKDLVKLENTGPGIINKFSRSRVAREQFEMKGEAGNYRAITVRDGDLLTGSEIVKIKSENNILQADKKDDVVILTLVNRYKSLDPALAWIKNTGLKKGALASSIAHDNHNIIAMGTNSADIAAAVNLIIDNQGGMSWTDGEESGILKLPVAGLMSTDKADLVSHQYKEMNMRALGLGTHLKAPFMTLSFMALLVIPEFKIGDKGLFDVKEFKFVDSKTD